MLRENNKSAPAAGKEEGETGCDGPRVNNEEGADTCTGDTDTLQTLARTQTHSLHSGHLDRGGQSGQCGVDTYREALGKYRHTEAWIKVANWGKKRDILMWRLHFL